MKKHKNIAFIKTYCPFCEKALAMLKDRDISMEIVDVDQDSELYSALKDHTNHNTVPNIFLNGKHVGGSDDLEIHLEGE